MGIDRDNRRKHLTYLACVALVVGALLFPFLELPTALSDTKSRITDFGAETIEPLEKRGEAPVPLPVELVEEQGEEARLHLPAPGSSLFERKERGSETDESPEAAALLQEGDGEKTTVLNVTDADITALIKTFSKLTKRNYIVDSAVKGKVTIHFPSAVTIEEALRIFDSVLLLKGFTTVPVSDNVWKVIAAKDAKQTTVPLVKEPLDKSSDVLVTEMVRLKHVPAADMQQLMSQFISRDGVITAVEGTNSLVVIDSAANIKRLRELAKELDVPALDQEITIIPILYADATDIADKIQQILGEEEQKTQQPRVSPRSPTRRTSSRRRSTSSKSSSTKSISRRTLPLKIIPDERTNSLIVVADPELTLKVRALAEQLDSELDRSGGGFWVYRLRHADAEELAEIINNLISGAGEDTKTTRQGTQGSSLSTRRESRERRAEVSSRQQQRISAALERSRALLGARTARRAGADAEGGRVNLEGEVSIASDASTNSLIINASRADYLRLKEVIQALDIKRRQVLVEATLLEVSLTKDEGMGVELRGTASWDEGAVVGQTDFGSLSNLVSNPLALTDLTIAAASSGTITLPGGIVIPSQAALITAVSRNQDVNVLSSPTILATDNEEAEIIVGENVPFVTSTSTDPSNLNNTFNQIERQDVGITLRITPQISTGDFVTLKIFVEISNVVAGTRNDPNGPTTTIRTTETQVEVKNGQMVVTGGLIQDAVTDSTRGVPFFQDIPVIGNYFKRQDTNVRKNNLLVFITPRIITDQYEARENTVEAAGDMQQEITRRDIEPDREEVLESPSIDRVFETMPADPKFLPSTITPPKKLSSPPDKEPPNKRAEVAMQRTTERLRTLAETAGPLPTGDLPSQESTPPHVISGDSSEIIDITVSPELPQADAKAPQDPKPEQQIKTASLSRSLNVPTGARTYVVLRELSAPSNKSQTVGLSLVGALGSPTTSFFQVGQRFRFGSEDTARTFVCLGIYGSMREASVIHPELGESSHWKALSPEETLALGRKGWFRG